MKNSNLLYQNGVIQGLLLGVIAAVLVFRYLGGDYLYYLEGIIALIAIINFIYNLSQKSKKL
jgi:hypothetical protein